MKKNKITISIFTVVCLISTIIGYSLIKQNENHKYDQLAVMTQQNDGTYIRSNMSAFGNDDYEFDHAVCNNGSNVTANLNGGVNLKLLGTDKCIVYLRKLINIVSENIMSEVKTSEPDFTKIVPNYVAGENFIVNHIYEDYVDVVQSIDTPYNSEFTYNSATKQWESPTSYASKANLSFSVSEEVDDMAICYDSRFNGEDNSLIYFYLNGYEYFFENSWGSSCIRLGYLTPQDVLEFRFEGYEQDSSYNIFNFYLVDDFILDDQESGVYEMQDDYGTSYYFRGGVDKNYVKFGDYIWRIVRLNGDGTLRIVFDGTMPYVNGEFSYDDRALSTKSKFNNTKNNNAYVGYMYGNPSGTTYDEVHANINDSAIKTYLDSWYESNIRDKGLAEYVSDTLFCNDRSITSGTGIGTTLTNYGAYTRATTNADPILTCPQKNDAFTVDDTSKGNGVLKYPIGLLTVDEYRLAGGKIWDESLNGYLSKPGITWWLGSPYYYSYSNAQMFYVRGDGNISNANSINDFSVVPVINLTEKYVKKLKGSGTIYDPYTAD